jgi:ATP-dependent Lon protease
VVAPFDLGRRTSIAALDEAQTRSPSLLLVVAQRSPIVEAPLQSDLHSVGCVAVVLNRVANIHQGYRVILGGQERVALCGIRRTTPYVCARVSRFPSEAALTRAQRKLVKEIRKGAIVLGRAEGVTPEALKALEQIQEPENLVDLVAGNVPAPVDVKVSWLAAPLAERIPLVLDRIRALLAAPSEG